MRYEPSLILADKLTGDLDMQTEQEGVDIFCHLSKVEGNGGILVTYSPAVAKQVAAVYQLGQNSASAE